MTVRIANAVTFNLTDNSHGAVVVGWADGLRIAVQNLLTNAAVHGKPDGTVDVRIEATAAGVAVSVADDGPGILTDQRERVRERFVRGTGVSAPGTGLGLALVQQQADAHNGMLTLAESPGGGLMARLEIPAAP
jgi:two-component system sensor histidine kinase PrrB